LVAILDFIAYVDSFALGWMLVDAIANSVLVVGKTGTRLRFFGTSFLTMRYAILIAYAQIIGAMITSYFIVDAIFGMMQESVSALVPVTMAALGLFHLYVLFGLPYKRTWARAAPSIGLILGAILVYYSPAIAAYIFGLFQ
jgi:hypothetical protein